MAKPITINLNEVSQDPDRAKIKYGNKAVVCKMYSMNKSTLNDWLKDMRSNPKFADAVVNPTHKIVLINLDRFEDYFRWLEKNRYRR
ncbi:excisionase, putative [Carnobacterium sp. AT7]|uniref:hypothetical protein n=1 Tax=Carnobacterium sp. AT7 TaxID=333990 RepID=UPI00015F10DB|nr:hypothetical protein [Carnobacterium sp. AT7]EDP68449.1 excisionase, putative [Carnobacterium sp. AT7]